MLDLRARLESVDARGDVELHEALFQAPGARERLAQETGRFGDRRCQLTVIGDVTQVDPFTDALRRCFLTEDEIEHWQSGGSFPDPWPDNYVRREG